MSNSHDLIIRVVGDVRSGITALKEIREGVEQTGKSSEQSSKLIQASAERNVKAYAAQREKLQTLAGEYRAIAKSASSSAKEQEAAAALARRATERLEATQARASRQAREHASSVGGLTRSLAGYAGAYIGVTGVLGVAEQSIQAFTEERLAAQRLHAEFGTGASQVERWSKTTAQSIAMWQGQSEKAVANVGQMLEVMGLVPKRAQAMSEGLVTLAAKVGFLRQEDPEKVLNMFEAGLAGRGRALKTLGFWLDDTTLKAKAMQMGLISASRDQVKIGVLTDRLAVDQAKYAAAVAKFGAGSTQAHSANEALVSTHEKLAKAIDGVVPKLTTEQKAIAANASLMQQGKTYVDAFARAHGSGAFQLKEFHAVVKQLEEGIGQGLLPAVVQILTPVNKWIASSKNQKTVTRDVVTVVHDLEKAVKAAVPIIQTLYHDADHVAHFLGGWRNAALLLLALKFAGTVGRWSTAIQGLIGKSGGGGLAGAESAAGGLGGRLGALAKIGTIAIGIDLVYSSSGDMSAKGVLENMLGGALVGGSVAGLPGALVGATVTGAATAGYAAGTALGHWIFGPSAGPTNPLGNPADLRLVPNDPSITPYKGPVTKADVQRAIDNQILRDAAANEHRRQAERHHKPIPDYSGDPLYVGHGAPKGRKTKATSDTGRAKLIEYALTKLGDPYVWGAAGPNSFDCSGLVMWALSQEGVNLPHSTYAQVQMGKHVDRSKIQAGDVVFTNYGESGKKGPGHEGLYIGHGLVEEAPHTGDKVKIVKLQDFVGKGTYEIRDFLGPGHDKGLSGTGATAAYSRQQTLLGLKVHGLELEQTVMQTLGKLPDNLKVIFRNKLGNIIDTETIGQIRTKAEQLLKVIATATDPAKVRDAVKGLQELGKQARGAVSQMITALKTAETQLHADATRALNLLLQLFDAKTQQMIQHAQAKVKMASGLSFTVSADQSDPNGLTPAERQMKDMQDAHDEADRQQAISDAKQALAQASTDAERKAAQKQLDDALYAEKMAELQKEADAERQAADKSIAAAQQELSVKRELEKQSFIDAYNAIMAKVQSGTETAAEAQKQILGLLKKYGLDANTAAQLLGNTFGNELARSLNKVYLGLLQITNELRRMQGLPPIKIHIQPVIDPTQDNSGGGDGSLKGVPGSGFAPQPGQPSPPFTAPPGTPGPGFLPPGPLLPPSGHNLGNAAAGDIFSPVPGGLYKFVEGGHPETVISHDPRFRARSMELIKQTIAAIAPNGVPGFKRGGVVDPGGNPINGNDPKTNPTTGLPDTPAMRAAAMWLNDYGTDKYDKNVATALMGELGPREQAEAAMRPTSVPGFGELHRGDWRAGPPDPRWVAILTKQFPGIVFEGGTPGTQISAGQAVSRITGGLGAITGLIQASMGHTGASSPIERATSRAIHLSDGQGYFNPMPGDQSGQYNPMDPHNQRNNPRFPGPAGVGFSAGGLVPGFDFGHDSVQAGLRPGELVMTPEQQHANARMLGYTGSNAAGFLMSRLNMPGGGRAGGYSGAGYVTHPTSAVGGGGGGEVHLHIEKLEVTGDLSNPSQRRQTARLLVDEIESELARRAKRVPSLGFGPRGT